MRLIQKPGKDEYPVYSSIYMDLLKDDGQILEHLKQNLLEIKKFVYSLPEEKLYYRYDEGKWTIKEILVHNIDDERIFSYRALRYARNDSTPIHGFDQDYYVKYSNANERSLESIFEEYEAVRNSTIELFKNLPEESLLRTGSGIEKDGTIVNERTVRALAYHLAGHELRHFNVIKERYI
ncbi:MAG: DinB family protein [Winogradskyella sp.]